MLTTSHDAHPMLSTKQSSRSIHSSPSRATRARSSFDDLGTHLNAEVAAAEAMRRAQAQQPMVDISIVRRRTRTRTSEGSHLAEARLGRRQSNRDGRKRETIKHAPPRNITRRSSPEPASSSIVSPQSTTTSHRARPIRRAPSTTAQGSPKSRTKQDNDAQFVDFSCVANAAKEPTVKTESRPPTRPSIRETQTDEEILSIARDKCLQDFQQHKLRERKSFFFESIQRFRGRQTTPQDSRPFVPDNTLPPFNQVDQMPLLTPEPPFQPPELMPVIIKKSSKARVLSLSLKGRIKKIFRSTSRDVSGILPPQHVQARHLHMSMNGNDLAAIGARQDYERFSTVMDMPPPPTIIDPASIDGSRVTSWATATVNGASNDMSQRPDSAAASQRTLSAHRLKQRASFFGHGVQHKLRKASRADIKDTGQSQGLYNALQGLIHSQRSPRPPSQNVSATIRQESAIITLPSQQHTMRTSSMISGSAPSIRAVKSEDPASTHLAMSPVIEVTSPQREHTMPRGVQGFSPQQLLDRMERSHDRWQHALNTTTTNPYELTPMTASANAASGNQGGMPQHVKHGRSQALSPSIYSQPTDSAPSRNTTPDMATTTLVTITGREVKRYTISPAKNVTRVTQEQPVQFSAEWRRWMSGQLRDMTVATTDSSGIEQAVPKAPAPTTTSTTTSSNSTDVVTTEGKHTHCSRTPSSARSLRPSKQRRSSSRQSSLMNERYPMIDSDRNSSNESVRTRKASRQSQRKDNRAVTRAPSIVDLVEALRSNSAQSTYETISKGERSTSQQDHYPRKAPSRTELRAKFSHKLSTTAKSIGIQRKGTGNQISLVIDETVQNISAGPYAVESRPSNVLTVCHENTLPRDNVLPALSSSEWLAGPSAKQVSKRAGKNGSPGQRLVTGWLEGRPVRRSEDSPAFV